MHQRRRLLLKSLTHDYEGRLNTVTRTVPTFQSSASKIPGFIALYIFMPLPILCILSLTTTDRSIVDWCISNNDYLRYLLLPAKIIAFARTMPGCTDALAVWTDFLYLYSALLLIAVFFSYATKVYKYDPNLLSVPFGFADDDLEKLRVGLLLLAPVLTFFLAGGGKGLDSLLRYRTEEPKSIMWLVAVWIFIWFMSSITLFVAAGVVTVAREFKRLFFS